jgi:hypothetical protein
MTLKTTILADSSSLSLAVAAIGVIACVLGLFGVVRPGSLTTCVKRLWSSPMGIGTTLALRISVGLILIAAASETRFPKILIAIGVLSLIKALFIPLLGRARQQNLFDWWCLQPTHYIRDWSLIACAFGIFLIYAAISDRDSNTVTTARTERFLTSNAECRDSRSAILYLLLSGISK